LVVVDSGDLLNEDEEIPESVMESAKLKAEVIVRIYNHIGIDAVNVGELDLVLGVAFLKGLEKKHHFPFISANLTDDTNTPIFKRYVIRQVNGKKVGIFGLIGDTSEMVSKVKKLTDGTVRVQDTLKAAELVVQELTGKVDYMVAVTYQKTNRDWVIARRVDGIDLVVGGHDRLKTREPSQADETLIVRAGEKNQYQGMLEITLDGTKTAKNSVVPLGGKIADDAEVKAMLHEYNNKVVELYRSASKEGNDALGTTVSRSAVCAPCHSEQVEQWQTTDHAKAYETLVKNSKQYDPNCLRCHTTRFEQPKGFSMEQQQPSLVNVGCENCHGFAEDHLSEMRPIPIPSPDMELCLECHSSDRCPDFEGNAQVVFEKITH
jgi:2',3'-cyclic-nucleotide 2'-phosphodiesterase (5'-nucleotidase family)